MNTGASKPRKRKYTLTTVQKWLLAGCVVLSIAWAGVLVYRSLFE